jgi:hypothetical protein
MMRINGCGLSKLPRQAKRGQIDRYLGGDDWWREVAVFSISMSARPEALGKRFQGDLQSNRWRVIEEAIRDSFPKSSGPGSVV